MTRRFDNIQVYRIPTEHALYHVLLTRIKNDVNGKPRYEAFITTSNDDAAYHYRFSGHYYGDAREADYIVGYHETNTLYR